MAQNLNPRWIDCPAGHVLDADETGGMTTKPRYQTLVDGASIAWNAALGAVAEVTITEARALANPTNLKAGEQYVLIVRGAYALTWGDAYEWGTEPTLAAENVFVFQCDGTKLYPIESGPSAHALDAHTTVTLAELNAIISDADLGPAYTLPTASADTLGGVKVGANLSITDGVLSATGGLTEDQVRNLIIVWA